MAKRGSVVVHELPSKVLESNPLKDPVLRDVLIYLPPDYDERRAYPALLALAGFTGTGASLFNRDPLGEDLAHRLDRLILSGACGPVVVVAPDCFTKFGGNQYINSTATGRYEDYLLEEVLPFAERTVRISRWGVFGKSSGGYGAMVLGMRNPTVFSALADHSGDSNFELCYIPDFADAMDQFRDAGGPAEWLNRFWQDENRHRKKYMRPLNVFAMAAHYSPNPESKTLGVEFPFDLETGVFRPEVWERWRAWDPVNMVENHAENLKKLRLVYLDCGKRDEFSLIWGARALRAKLSAASVPVHYEEFDDGHMSISYRYDTSLPLLVRALSE